MESLPFKVCTKCGHEWHTKEQFVLDTSLRVYGYNAMFERPEDGVIILIHETPDCEFSFSIRVGELADLHVGKRYRELRFLNPECEGKCFKVSNLTPCTADCSLRWARDVLQYLREHKLPDKTFQEVEAMAPNA